MSDPVTALAVDLGSSSARLIAATLDDAGLQVREIHRFAHHAADVGGQLVWDIDRLYDEVITGLRAAVAEVPNPVSVSVDSWGVDFVCLEAAGQRVGPARAYRDERTTRTLGAFRERIDDESFFAATGIAPATINSANQLFALVLEEPELATRVDKVVFLPDWFTWRLSGRLGWSRSITSTSGLCTPGARSWSTDVFDALDLPQHWVGELTDELCIAGPCTVEGLEQLTVVRAGAHDTACAVTALPVRDSSSLFLSCGSWSVMGVTTETPLMNASARAAGIANEVRADGGFRPLINLTGLWIVQEAQRDWHVRGEPSDTVGLIDAARRAPDIGVTFDPDDPSLLTPGHMVSRIQALLAAGGAQVHDRGQLVRAILASLAQRYARAVESLARAGAIEPQRIVVVGGGVRNELLLDLTHAATGLEVVRGPAEASAMGSVLGQFLALGILDDEQVRRLAGGAA